MQYFLADRLEHKFPNNSRSLKQRRPAPAPGKTGRENSHHTFNI